MTRASGKDHAGGDVAMRGDGAYENSGGHPSSEGPDSGRESTTRREPREVSDELSSATEQHLPRRVFGKRRRKSAQLLWVAIVENNALGWVSISSAGALDMTHCDFSVTSARDEMRHIVGNSEPDVIIKSDRDQNRGCRRKDKDHIESLCELYEAQVARGRYFVHELTSEVNSRMKCFTKIMAMLGTRTTVANLWMFGLAVCDARTRDSSKQVYGRSPTRDKLE